MLPLDGWHKIRPGIAAFAEPGVRGWQKDVDDGHLTVLAGLAPRAAGEDRPKWHMSISHRTNEARPQPGRYPKWDEIADARYRFVPDNVTMAMLLPPRSEYVNMHETCFHLWEVDGEHA
jgi:hypothetical protein